MSTVGETLHRERLRTGLDLEKIAQDTKISVRTLELIEANQFEKLPGGVFARSFVRQYARAVGLDEEEIVGELEKMLAPPVDPLPTMQEATRQPEIRMPRVARWGRAGNRIRTNSSLPALALVVLVMIACSAAYTWWQRSRHTPTPAEAADTRAVQTPVQTPEPAAQVPVTPTEAARTAEVSTPASPKPETRPPETPAQNVSGTVTTDEAGALHIALTAEEPTWVRATANGKVVFSGIIQAKETKALSAPDTVTLRIGNAGGVAISLNGKAIPAIGPKGQVRVVQVSPDGGVQVAAPPKPQPVPPVAEQTRTL
jgi:cytoskeleton protein RodZ